MNDVTRLDAAHLVPLAAGFSLWRPLVLRGAGFPVCEVLRLALPEVARQIDVLLEIESQLDVGRAKTVAALTGERSSDGQLAISGGKALKKILTGQPVDFAGLPPPIASALSTLQDLAARLDAHRSEAQRGFASGQQRASAEIRSIAGENHFREAVLWQNRTAAVTGLDALLRSPIGSTASKVRQHERLAASYLQRYCTKADSIGFFGPLSWGRIASAGAAISLEPGATLLAQRRVYFEYWGIDALAQSLAALPGMKPWMAPRRRPTVRSGPGTWLIEDGGVVPVTPAAERLVALCDGDRSAREIVRVVAADPGSGLSNEAEGFQVLEELQAQRVLLWTLEVPVGSPFPERKLGAVLQSIGEPQLRDLALAPLAELMACKEAVARAAGEPDQLDLALEQTEKTFLHLTGIEGTRNEGRTYAGRTLLYEDCTRDIQIQIGPTVIDRLREPLALLLQSARWWMYTIASKFRGVFREAFDELRRQAGSDKVPYPDFARAVEHHFTGGATRLAAGGRTLVGDVAEELQRRWSTVLNLAPEKREQRFRAIDLGPRVSAEFAAPHSGSPLFRYHCPDLMIAAESAEAIVRGDFQFVLSELHTGMHTYASQLFLEACDDPDAMIRAYGEDLSHIEFLPILTKERHIRSAGTTLSDADVHFETTDARSWMPRRQVMAVGDLFIEAVGSELRVCNTSDDRTFDVLDFHAFYILRAAANLFQMLPATRHSPRVVIDDLVVAREFWRLDRSEIPFLGLKDAFDRFVAARRLTRELGWPRFVFAKVPEEKKPFFVDLESSIYLDLFAHLVRKSSKITISEMLPDPTRSWLPDQEGNRYICELRMAALDHPV